MELQNYLEKLETNIPGEFIAPVWLEEITCPLD
jgi:hypothetical protein